MHDTTREQVTAARELYSEHIAQSRRRMSESLFRVSLLLVQCQVYRVGTE